MVSQESEVPMNEQDYQFLLTLYETKNIRTPDI